MHSPLTDNTFGWFPSILKCSKDVKVAGVFIVIFILTLAICLRNHQCSSVLTCSFKSHPTFTGAILAVLRELPEGGAVSVDRGEQHRPRQAAPTLAFSHSIQIWKRLETRRTSPLRAGRLVWQVLACFTACQAAVIISRQRVWTVWRHQTDSSTLKCLRAVIVSHPTLIPTNLWHAPANTKALPLQKKS